MSALEKIKRWIMADEEEEQQAPERGQDSPRVTRRRGSLLSLHPGHSDEIFIRHPHSREEAQACVDCLRSRAAVVANLSGLEATQRQRIFDFLLGAIYALDGQMEEAGEAIFLLTPRDILITQDQGEQAFASQEWRERTPSALA